MCQNAELSYTINLIIEVDVLSSFTTNLILPNILSNNNYIVYQNSKISKFSPNLTLNTCFTSVSLEFRRSLIIAICCIVVILYTGCGT